MGHTVNIYFQKETLEELFEDVSLKENLSKEQICPATELSPFSCKKRLQYYHYCANQNISGYIDGHLYIKPTHKLVKLLSYEMDSIVGDSKFFKFTERNDGTYLISCVYNSIIGSRWLAIFNKKDVEKFFLKSLQSLL